MSAPGPRPATHRAVRIGLTGPIGCGKTTVAGWLAARGAATIDADAIARSVSAPGEPVHDAILARFGSAVAAADGTLDRAALARVAFGDERDLADLEAIVHPAVRARIVAALEEADREGVRAVVVEAIKLVEGGLAELCDEVWLVDCPPGVQRARLAARGMSPADAERRMVAQRSLRAHLRRWPGVRVLDTSGSREATERAVEAALAAATAR